MGILVIGPTNNALYAGSIPKVLSLAIIIGRKTIFGVLVEAIETGMNRSPLASRSVLTEEIENTEGGSLKAKH